MILGITGSIASGKSLVVRMFEESGAAIVSADQIARDIVTPDSEVLRLLVEHFGQVIIREDGSLDRDRLGRIVFDDGNARAELNRITHPAIAQLALERLRSLAQSGAPLVVYEAPLLFEAKAESRVDRVLVVTVDPETQLQRLMSRDSLSLAEAKQRINAQMTQEEKLARSDYVIDNSGTIEATREQVQQLWDRLVNGAR